MSSSESSWGKFSAWFLVGVAIMVGGLAVSRRRQPAQSELEAGGFKSVGLFGDVRAGDQLSAELEIGRVEDGKKHKSSFDMIVTPPPNPSGQGRQDEGYTVKPMEESEEREGPVARGKARPAPVAVKAEKKLGPEDEALLQKLGGPKDGPGLQRVGGSYELMAGLVSKLVGHPKILGFLFNNDMLVDAYMSRPKSQRNCTDPQAWKEFLMDTKDPKGIRNSLPIAMAVAHGDPQNSSVVAGSKLVNRMLECPALKTFLHDGPSVQEVALANPAILTALVDPAVFQGIMSNPAALTAFSQVQSAGVMGGAGSPNGR
ncbi:MAG: hypothetical protein WC728_11360 [Elusimicrobiota bacterium]